MISIDFDTKIISVPQSYLTFISGTLYELDTETFRTDILALMDDTEGIVFEDTHIHNTEVVLGGVTFARFIEFINGYTITFEDGMYRVRLVGSNNNISDVTNLNSVSILSQNSAGLVKIGLDSADIAAAVWNALRSGYVQPGSMGEAVTDLLSMIAIVQGLVHDNAYIDTQVWITVNGQPRLQSARVRTYDSEANANTHGATGLLETHTMTATYDGLGNQTSFLMTRAGS